MKAVSEREKHAKEAGEPAPAEVEEEEEEAKVRLRLKCRVLAHLGGAGNASGPCGLQEWRLLLIHIDAHPCRPLPPTRHRQEEEEEGEEAGEEAEAAEAKEVDPEKAKADAGARCRPAAAALPAAGSGQRRA